VTPALGHATKVGVIVALACGATYLTAAGRDALGDGARAARSAAARQTTTTPLAATAEQRPPAALFIGDGYTSGAGDVDRQHTFACLTADSLGWICNNAGQAGTGYLAGRPYADRVATYQRLYAADYVVVSGGGADAATPLPQRVTAAQRTFDTIAAAFPKATVVVVGPFAAGDDPGTDTRAVDAALAAEARRRGWLFVGTLDPPWIPTRLAPALLREDGEAPTAAGHGHLAALLTAALRESGITTSEPSRATQTHDVRGDR
jgi:hypothetical protein